MNSTWMLRVILLISVTNFRLVCLLPIIEYTYVLSFFDPRVGRHLFNSVSKITM